jgi:serine/threonine-protein kinase
MTTMPCPDQARLSALLHGELSEAEQSDLGAHLEGCSSCQETLQGLAAGSGSWAGIAEQLGSDDLPAESALHDLMNRLVGATLQAETQTGGGTNGTTDAPLNFLSPAEKPDQLGKLGHYEVIEVLGRGAFGVVLKAFDPKLHRIVAIKVLAPHFATSASARKRFNREAKSAAAVSHDHVVAIHAVEDAASPPYIVMYFVAGQSLQQRLDRDGTLQVKEVLRIGMQAARGLAAAHAQGLVHRDIKPANILLENGVERVKLTDFGLARAADDASLTQSGVIAGTPQFMAPEQARGDTVDHRADLFSLGSVLYTMCAGRPPFRASTTMGVLKRVCDDEPRAIREINSEIPD